MNNILLALWIHDDGINVCTLQPLLSKIHLILISCTQMLLGEENHPSFTRHDWVKTYKTFRSFLCLEGTIKRHSYKHTNAYKLLHTPSGHKMDVSLLSGLEYITRVWHAAPSVVRRSYGIRSHHTEPFMPTTMDLVLRVHELRDSTEPWLWM